jgi:hypothetical protein
LRDPIVDALMENSHATTPQKFLLQ